MPDGPTSARHGGRSKLTIDRVGQLPTESLTSDNSLEVSYKTYVNTTGAHLPGDGRLSAGIAV